MKKLMWLGVGVLGVGAAFGCSSIRVVQRTPAGGVVALVGDREGATEKAQEYMRSQCPKGFDVVEEGEAVVGQDIQTESRESRGFLGPQTSTRGSTTDKREWRIKYACKGEGGAKQGSIRELVVRY